MKSYEVEIEGVAPGLLMHKFSDDQQAELAMAVKRAGKQAPDAKIEAEAGAYRLDDGGLYQPSEHIYQSMVKAAGEFQIKGRGKKTYKDAVKGNIIIDPDCIPHKSNEYKIDARPVRIQRARVIRRRPHLPTWALGFRITVIDDDAVPGEVLNAILVKAGQCVGIGDYRPRFGRFVVTKFESA